MRQTLKILGWACLGLMLLVLLIALAVGALLGTTAGSRWVLGKAPGVHVEDFRGRLGGEWQAQRGGEFSGGKIVIAGWTGEHFVASQTPRKSTAAAAPAGGPSTGLGASRRLTRTCGRGPYQCVLAR